ncbi:hypothetical protein H257_19492 [Aphanomyces astaci]|uniref:ATP-dependent DNA helicase n=1 Tax=Aphanomyces astaci TaxID=112090 RepID=W4F9V0_APHAT|nr:hypothetical protein H257_19492 [Aphanomyces astaci]ETV63581.1 hypothetical protein H257_19492 [Aphanomyces astaci]|eukprot:XP_009846935.1 hypothetical protein H257_19492 [Aphanomyces astaci]
MTINKSQGQSLKVMGSDLETPCFSHGQFAVQPPQFALDMPTLMSHRIMHALRDMNSCRGPHYYATQLHL